MSQERELTDVVQLLIDLKADVNAAGEETLDCGSDYPSHCGGYQVIKGKKPLCAAVQRGSPVLVKLLLDAKAEPVHTYQRGTYTDLHKQDPCDPRKGVDAEILALLRNAR